MSKLKAPRGAFNLGTRTKGIAHPRGAFKLRTRTKGIAHPRGAFNLRTRTKGIAHPRGAFNLGTRIVEFSEKLGHLFSEIKPVFECIDRQNRTDKRKTL